MTTGNITHNTDIPLKEGFWKIPMLCRSRTETLGIPSSGLVPYALAQWWKPKWAQQVLLATSHATADFLQQSGMHSRWEKFHGGDLNVKKIEYKSLKAKQITDWIETLFIDS